MTNTTHDTLTKMLALRRESKRLIALVARAESLGNPSAEIREMMDLASCKIKQNAREYLALLDTLPVQGPPTMTNTTHDTLTKMLALRRESKRLIALVARAESLGNPSAEIREMMDLASCKIKQNAREYLALLDTLPVQ